MPSMLKGVESGANFALKLFVIYGVWISIIKLLEKSGADKKIASFLSPFAKKLFKNESEDAYKFLTLNLSANLIGMGGGATPMGIRAMESMQIKKNRIMLLVLNSCGIQLIPTTILALRAGLGATTNIILPALIVNLATTVVGVVLVKVLVR